MKKPGKNKFIILVLVILLIIFLLVYLYINLIDYANILEKKEIYSSLIIGNGVGIALNGSSLIFGMTSPGSTSNKYVNFTNEYTEDVKVSIYVNGNISDFVSVNNNNFVLKPGEATNLVFSAHGLPNVNYGKYEGKVVIVIRKTVWIFNGI